MSNVITLPSRAKADTSTAHYQEVAVYGHAGPLTVTLARHEGAPGWLHVLLLGSAVGLEIVASLPDDEKGRAVADFVGPAVLRTVELSETEFAAQPEAC
ncbi:hypothetical protein [Methylobacterium radiotolerans]|uniref:hypothetical protein n=1 Tax=Methylobacterium radiotolerans TaxID=31998 RepID=UPI001F291680|nr:hypothetical protein [Methylobacterium radiotolerans]UIY45588.1 hypothetical protein LZ599_31305 [Methylobacterium radiotolerans]